MLMQQSIVWYDNSRLSVMETQFGFCIMGPTYNDEGLFTKRNFNVDQIVINSENPGSIDWEFMEFELAGIKKDCECTLKTEEQLNVRYYDHAKITLEN